MRTAKVSNREFVVTWTRSDSLDDVVKTLGMKKPAVVARAAYLRKLGVKLKKFHGQGGKLTAFDIAQLNDLIKKTERG